MKKSSSVNKNSNRLTNSYANAVRPSTRKVSIKIRSRVNISSLSCEMKKNEKLINARQELRDETSNQVIKKMKSLTDRNHHYVMTVEFYDHNEQPIGDSAMTNDIEFVEAKLEEDLNLDKVIEKFNVCWETQKAVSLRGLIEYQRNYLWERYSDGYPKDDQDIASYNYDKVSKQRIPIWKPKSWGQFVDHLEQILPKEHLTYLELLEGGGNSEFGQLSDQIHGEDQLTNISMMIAELTDERKKVKYQSLLNVIYNINSSGKSNEINA